uniref:Uncharacterized protein n=1 Tax=Tetranychus urticae TaxID=32264 RepID=T1JXN8_TETUR
MPSTVDEKFKQHSTLDWELKDQKRVKAKDEEDEEEGGGGGERMVEGLVGRFWCNIM